MAHKQDNHTLTAADLWQQAAATLRTRLPRVDFETWLRDLQPVALQPPVLILETANSFARDTIRENYAEALGEVLSGIDPACETVRLVLPGDPVEPADPPLEDSAAEAPEPGPAPPSTAAVERAPQPAPPSGASERLTLTPRYLNAYDEIVHPERIIAFPAYYLRWIPYLGVDLAWLPIGFRQVAFLRGLEYRAGSTFQASGREIARWSGMGQRTFWRRVKDPLLRWFVRPQSDAPAFSVGEDGRPHREPSRWEVVLSMPLTPQDQHALRSWLRNQRLQGHTAVHILDTALQLDPDDLFPPPPDALPEEVAGEPLSVQQVVREVLATEDPDAARSLETLADSLAVHLLGGSLLLTHYFVRRWLPLLGAGPGWLVTLLRALNPTPGAAESEFEIANGYPDLAARLGIGDPWRIARWLRGQGRGASHLRFFLEEIQSRKQSNQQVARAFWITRVDSPTPADRQAQEAAREAGTHSRRAARVSGSHNQDAVRVSGTVSEDRPRGSGSHAAPAARDSGTSGQGGPREPGSGIRADARGTGTGYSGGFNPDSSHTQLSFLETTTSSTAAGHAETGTWSWEGLLTRARVAHPRADQLQRSRPALFVSWLLYAASERGHSLRDPIGHAVSRLLEDPGQGAGPAWEELADLGPDALGSLLLRELGTGDARWAHPAWGRAMDGARADRLQQLAELIGLDWRDADVPRW